VPVRFIFDSVLRNGALYRKQPNDSEATFHTAVDAGSWEELNFLLDVIFVG
jgi:hypothetical protein